MRLLLTSIFREVGLATQCFNELDDMKSIRSNLFSCAVIISLVFLASCVQLTQLDSDDQSLTIDFHQKSIDTCVAQLNSSLQYSSYSGRSLTIKRARVFDSPPLLEFVIILFPEEVLTDMEPTLNNEDIREYPTIVEPRYPECYVSKDISKRSAARVSWLTAGISPPSDTPEVFRKNKRSAEVYWDFIFSNTPSMVMYEFSFEKKDTQKSWRLIDINTRPISDN